MSIIEDINQQIIEVSGAIDQYFEKNNHVESALFINIESKIKSICALISDLEENKRPYFTEQINDLLAKLNNAVAIISSRKDEIEEKIRLIRKQENAKKIYLQRSINQDPPKNV